jgi:hypothetical protein
VNAWRHRVVYIGKQSQKGHGHIAVSRRT